MHYRTLGRTGLEVSVVGFGASPLGGVFGEVSEAVGTRAVRAALDLGVNFFDVSPYYGLTKAETALGRALRGVDRSGYFLATKVGRYGAAMKDFDFSAERVTRSVDESLGRLGVDHVDLIQCHDVEFGDLQQVIDETLPALEKVVATGKARFVGITGLPLKVFPRIIDAAGGCVDTVLSYCHYTLNDDSFGGMLPYLDQKGVGIINAAPLSMGLLSEVGPREWHPASAAIKAACAKAALACRERGTDIARLALQFAVAEPRIATTVIGIASEEQIVRNVKWASEPMDEELLATVRGILAPVHNQTWSSGRPENNGEAS